MSVDNDKTRELFDLMYEVRDRTTRIETETGRLAIIEEKADRAEVKANEAKLISHSNEKEIDRIDATIKWTWGIVVIIIPSLASHPVKQFKKGSNPLRKINKVRKTKKGYNVNRYIAFIGGALGGVLLFLQSLGIDLPYFTDDTIDAFVQMMESFVPLILVGYGVWKNQYIVSGKAKIQENELKKRGLK